MSDKLKRIGEWIRINILPKMKSGMISWSNSIMDAPFAHMISIVFGAILGVLLWVLL